MYETQLSIVIVNYNVKYFLQQCLYSVRAATQGLETDIYVVDNHSTDQSVEYLRPLFPEVTFIENTENVGFAKANNQALRICKGEYVLILNPDWRRIPAKSLLLYGRSSRSRSLRTEDD